MTTTRKTKEQWTREYARKILKKWQQQPSPFGIDQQYLHKIEHEISRHFDNPLTKSLIEKSF